MSSDNLTDGWAASWYGARRSMAGLVSVDGDVYRFAGAADASMGTNGIPAAQQVGYATVTPTSSAYQFSAGGVLLTVQYTTPFLAAELDFMSRPVTYITLTTESTDGRSHAVHVYVDSSAEIAVNDVSESVQWQRVPQASGLTALRIGTVAQNILGASGDRIGINWGYLYLAAPTDSKVHSFMGSVTDARMVFNATGSVPKNDDTRMPRAASDNWPGLALSFDLATKPDEADTAFYMFAYDDIYAINYFGLQLPAYWRRYGEDGAALLVNASKQYDDMMLGASELDEVLMDLAEQSAGGAEYGALLGLTYRQALGAMKLTWHPKLQTAWYFLKEISSDGDLSTVDVIYPAAPILLALRPEFLVRQCLPLLAYGNNETSIPYPPLFAPHHLGYYPIGNIQASQQENMPIEETANMLLMLAAAAYRDPQVLPLFHPHYSSLLLQWADYLVANLPDPGNQLCTDDFEGPSPHNANLAAKGILGIGAYAVLCDLVGDHAGATKYMSTAQTYANAWTKLALEKDHYLLQYYSTNTWSLKYNLLFQPLLNLSLFDASVFTTELSFYTQQKLNPYGVPLDNRGTFTKLDWLCWVAALGNAKQQQQLLHAAYQFAKLSPSRMPLSDLYYTDTGKVWMFIARPVVGGVFAPLLLNQLRA